MTTMIDRVVGMAYILVSWGHYFIIPVIQYYYYNITETFTSEGENELLQERKLRELCVS